MVLGASPFHCYCCSGIRHSPPMIDPIQILVHASQFPQAVRDDLVRSLRERAVNHKFHYDSYKQTQKWLALHEAYSPSRTDPDCQTIYEASFASAATSCAGPSLHLVGLGAGGGQKDARLLQELVLPGRVLRYTPIDVSAPMVLVAANVSLNIAHKTTPIVADLLTATDLSRFIDSQPATT